jgi:hypothetical protein
MLRSKQKIQVKPKEDQISSISNLKALKDKLMEKIKQITDEKDL